MKSLRQMLAECSSLDALTLWQPWAWAIATPEAGKDVENRGWYPPKSKLGRPLAIHAGLTYDDAAAHDLREGLGLKVPDKRAIVKSAVVAVAVLERAVEDSPSAWAVPGQKHWCLAQVTPLAQPVACKGAQGLWALPGDVFRQVRQQLLAEASPVVAPGVEPAERTDWRVVQCEDCGRPIMGWGKGPHRHGGYLVGGPTGRVDCLGRPWANGKAVSP